jgi:hypothetical protein
MLSLRSACAHGSRRGGRASGGSARAGRALICVPFVLLCGCIYLSRHTPPGACAHDLGSPLRNFCVVAPGVFWRGAAPGRADAAWLLEHRVGTIASLSPDLRHAFESARLEPGLERRVRYFQVRFPAIELLTHHRLDDRVAQVLAIIEEEPKPVFVNCRAGVDRTGIVAAAYRVLIQNESRTRAIAEMDAFHSPWDRLNARYIRSLSGTRKAKILRDMRRWEHRLEPSGELECGTGGCRFHPQPGSAARVLLSLADDHCVSGCFRDCAEPLHSCWDI